MSQKFTYSVVVALPREQTWSLLTDIAVWPKFSSVYSDLRWEGTPWTEGSAIVGRLNYPIVVEGRYVVKACEPPAFIRYLSQTRNAGFATERTIRLDLVPRGTKIHVEAFIVGRPPMAGDATEFLKELTTRWVDDFARFCNLQASSDRTVEDSRTDGHRLK